MLTTLDQKEAVRKLIEERRVTTLFQPIRDLVAGRLLGIEALSRPDESYQPVRSSAASTTSMYAPSGSSRVARATASADRRRRSRPACRNL
jgi:EAL domain-containing protein (putative c-di-GMP-specific phosphodiesterase class I)